MTDTSGLGTILGVWAHPDDETYLCGGMMARAVRSGNRVVCITATRGELGSPDEERWPSGPSLAAVRTKEMETALAALGVTEHIWLDYPDGGCATVDQDEAVRRVTALMADVQPDTVLTFGPDGMTGHEGHKSVSAWVSDAFEEAAKPGARLFHATATPEWAEVWVPRLEPFDVFLPGTPPITPRGELAIDYTLPDDMLDLKFRAIQAHESQVEGLVQVFGDRMREWMATEYFRLASERAI